MSDESNYRTRNVLTNNKEVQELNARSMFLVQQQQEREQLQYAFVHHNNNSPQMNRNDTGTHNFEPTPLSSPNEKNSIAACLLTMDDNHFLIEWLAYHYHVLPLRHLIVAVDPRARTSPQEIFNRWDGLINITVWNDTDIFGNKRVEDITEAPDVKKRNRLLMLHRFRQMALYVKCMRQFKSDGHQWVMLLDTDEFMVVKANHHEDIRWPGSVLKYLKEEEADSNNDNHKRSSTHNNTPACLPLPRRRYGTKESLLRYQSKHVPKGFNSSDFLTMRWRYYGMKDKNEMVKTMIDVSRVDWDDLYVDTRKSNGVHAPLDICGDRVEMSLSESKLIASHYPGTWEQYNFRKDAREGSKAKEMKGKEAYIELKRYQDFHDDLHRDWLIGFEKSVGREEAQRLLEGVGKVSADHKSKPKQQNAMTPTPLSSPNEKNSIAACLLTMDDNHFLIEWLAYHYHVLPLRHLIVAVDPRARTSPQEIFNRWDGLINITVWNDTDIFGNEGVEGVAEAEKVKEENKLLTLHRIRQMFLYEKCMRQLKSDGHQWVMLLDTDEFMVVKANHHEDIRWPGSVLKYLKEEAPTDGNTPACLPLPRRRYGTKESLLRYQNKHVPKDFNSSDFLTMRWRHYGMKDKNVTIKSMIDVSRVDWDDLHVNPRKSYGVHAPLDICGDRVEMSLSESKLIASHYPGTWEQYNFRKDAREGSKAREMRGKEAYHNLGRFQVFHDDLHRDWLIGFDKSVGRKEALRLLKDVGQVNAEM